MILLYLYLAFIQQCLSFIYFVFKTDHLLLSAFNRFEKIYIRVVGIILLIFSLALIGTSLFTPYWIKSSQDIINSVNMTDTAHFNYGPFFLKISYDKDSYLTETTPWGENILYDWPNYIWSIALMFLFVIFIFGILVLLTIIYGLFSKDTSRTKQIVRMYMLINIILGFCVLILFPLGFSDMTSYKITWLNGINELCPGSSIYSLGTCRIDWAYILFIIGFMVLILAYNTIKFSEIKDMKENIIKNRKRYKLLPSTTPSECESLMVSEDNNQKLELV
jgi:hypothetical protein